MTPGPANRIVSELPRKSPTPIAPPIVIMVSWRCVRLRLSSGEPSVVFAREDADDATEARPEASRLLTPNHVTEHLSELVNLLNRVVVENRRPDDAGVEAAAEMLHQPRRVHVSVANTNAAVRHGFGNGRGQHVGKVKAKGRNALGEAGRVVDA